MSQRGRIWTQAFWPLSWALRCSPAMLPWANRLTTLKLILPIWKLSSCMWWMTKILKERGIPTQPRPKTDPHPVSTSVPSYSTNFKLHQPFAWSHARGLAYANESDLAPGRLRLIHPTVSQSATRQCRATAELQWACSTNEKETFGVISHWGFGLVPPCIITSSTTPVLGSESTTGTQTDLVGTLTELTVYSGRQTLTKGMTFHRDYNKGHKGKARGSRMAFVKVARLHLENQAELLRKWQ